MVLGMGGSSIEVSVSSEGFGETSAEAEAASHSIDSFGDAARSAIVPVALFGSTVDEAGDEAGEAGREAAAGAAGFAAMSASTDGLSARVGFLSGGLNTIIPLMGALVAAMLPIAAVAGGAAVALMGIATAFSAVIGTGILAFGQQRAEQNKEQLKQVNRKIERLEALEDTEKGLTQAQQQQLAALEEEAKALEDGSTAMGGFSKALKDMWKQLQPTIVAFGAQFVPLIESAINAFPTFVKRVLNSLGPLDQFVVALQELGAISMRVFPEFLGFLVDFGRQMIPVFMAAMRVILNGLTPAFEAVAGAGVGAARMFDQTIGLLGWLAESVREVVVAAGPLIGELRTLAFTVLNGAIHVVNEFVDSLSLLPQAFVPVVQAMNAFAMVTLDVMESTVGGVLDELIYVFLALGETVGLVVTDILSAFGLLRPNVVGDANDMAYALEQDFLGAVIWVSDIIQNKLKAMRQLWIQHRATVIATLRPMVSALSEFGGWLMRVLKPLKQFAKPLVEAALIVGSLMATLSAISATLSAAATAFAVAGAAVGLLLSPIGLLTLAIAGLIYAWRRNLFGIRDITYKVVNALRTSLGPFVAWLTRTFNKLLADAGRVFRGILSAAQRTWRPIQRTIGNAIRTARRLWNQLIDPLRSRSKQTFGGIHAFAMQYWPQIQTIMRLAVRVAKKAWDTFIKPLITDANRIFGAVRQFAAENWPKVQQTMRLAVRVAKKAWDTFIKPILSSAQQIFGAVRRFAVQNWPKVQRAVQQASRAVGKAWNTYIEPLRPYAQKLFDFILFVIRNTMRIVLDIFQTRLDGMVLVATAALDAIKGTFEWMLDTIELILRLALAAMDKDWGKFMRLLEDYAKDTFNGIIGFVRHWGGRFVDFIRWQIIEPVINTFRQLYNTLIGKSIIPRMFSAILRAARNFASNVLGRFRRMVSDVIGAFTRMKNRTLDRVNSLKNRAKSAVSSMISGIKNRATGWVDDFTSPFRKAKERVTREFNKLQNTLTGNSIVPDMMSEMMYYAHDWRDPFVGVFEDAREGAVSRMDDMMAAVGGLSADALDTGSFRRLYGTGTGGAGAGAGGPRSRVGLYIESLTVEATTRREAQNAADEFVKQLRRQGFTTGY